MNLAVMTTMFPNFDPDLVNDTSFKEDSVREVIILPLLTRLGYHASGVARVVRSKILVHPFIHIGTTQKKVTIVPDYTLMYKDRPIFILDAKAPSENVLHSSNIQQAYSYAIHPEIRVEYFGLCNGKELVVFSTRESKPLLHLEFCKFESNWDEIEKCMSPKHVENPHLRKFDPDAGTMMRMMGIAESTEMFLMGVRLNHFGRMTKDFYTASTGMVFAEKTYATSFDFKASLLAEIVAGIPSTLRNKFLDALSRAPFQALAELCIEVDIECHMTDEVVSDDETYTPLLITKVMASRFNTQPVSNAREQNIPSSIFKLREQFIVAT